MQSNSSAWVSYLPLSEEERRESHRRASAISAQRAKERREAKEPEVNPIPRRGPGRPPKLELEQESTLSLDPQWVVKTAFTQLFGGVAAVTGIEDVKIKPQEADIAATCITSSLEMAGLIRIVVYLLPLASIGVIVALIVPRLLLIRQTYAVRALQAQAKAEAAAAYEPFQVHPGQQGATTSSYRTATSNGPMGVPPVPISNEYEG